MKSSEGQDLNSAALTVVIFASISLAIMLLDLGWLMRDEIKYIWSRLRSSWVARVYVSTRYMGLISQIFNVYFSVRMYRGMHTSPTGCRVWWSYQAFTVQSLLSCVEGMFLHRLYALFFHSRVVLLLMCMFVVAQIASMGVSAGLSFPSNHHTVSCWVTKGNPRNALFSITTLTTNLVIFLMTFWRYFRLPTRWTRGGIGRVVIRDSALSLTAISVVLLFLTLCSLEVIKPSMSGNISFCLLVCTLWISIGRIIINHTKIQQEEQGKDTTWRGTVQLTSQIEMGESVLTLDTRCRTLPSDSLTESTLQGSISTPVTKSSQRSSSSTGKSDSPQEWFWDATVPHQQVRLSALSSRPATVEVSVSDSTLPSLSRAVASDGGVSSGGRHPRVDVDVHEQRHSASSPARPTTSVDPSAPNENRIPPSSERDSTSSRTHDA